MVAVSAVTKPNRLLTVRMTCLFRLLERELEPTVALHAAAGGGLASHVLDAAEQVRMSVRPIAEGEATRSRQITAEVVVRSGGLARPRVVEVVVCMRFAIGVGAVGAPRIGEHGALLRACGHPLRAAR